MTTPPTYLLQPEPQPMLFVDCPFCLSPLPIDPETGALDCERCLVHLELAPDAPTPRTAALSSAA